jgi:hypothetical protein
MTRARTVAVIAAAVWALAATAAHADLIAAVDVRGPGGDLDPALVNAATGARSSIPDSLATSADELHPSLDSTGQRMVFERVDLDAGTRRIVLADVATGREADLFTVFDPLQLTPALSDDGKTVTTGNLFEPDGRGKFSGPFTTTDVSGFPAGPFPHDRTVLSLGLPAAGRMVDVRPSGSLAGLRFDAGAAGELLDRLSFSSIAAEPGFSLGAPALGRQAGSDVVVFERAPANSTGFGPAKLAFIPASQSATATVLPAIVNAAGLDESHPAFTADGRYLGFVRHGTDNHDRLFAFDTQTQTLLNPDGVDLGIPLGVRAVILRRAEGGISLRVKATILSSNLGGSSLLSFNLASGSKIGILVQRVVGTTRLFGKTVPKLRLVGAVPLGSFRKGRSSVRWDGRVNGKRLKPGTYRVTPRAVASGNVIRELGTSRTVRVK